MTAQVPDRVHVRDTAHHLEVEGLSLEEMRNALTLYKAAIRDQSKARKALYTASRAMLEADVPLVAPATQRQVQREAALRDDLLENQGYETYESLAAKRDSLPSSVRTWVSRLREQNELFTVQFKRRRLIPAVQLDETGQLDRSISALVQPLLTAGLDGWSLWAWLCSPTGLLSGDVPADVSTSNPKRALKAANRAASEIRRATTSAG